MYNKLKAFAFENLESNNVLDLNSDTTTDSQLKILLDYKSEENKSVDMKKTVFR